MLQQCLIELGRPLTVVGLDPSLNNWGMARGIIDASGLYISKLSVIQPVLLRGKQVRQNSKDLDAAVQLFTATHSMALGADLIFAEVPVGSQSARAMASYGICCGVLGALRGVGRPFIEVTPTEVKMATVGTKTATKAEMINWATTQFPSAPWPRYPRNSEALISEAKAEHMADAIGAIWAGVKSNQFLQLLPLLKHVA